MKHAVSNIALSPYDHADELARLSDFGLAAIEVAPSRVWQDTWTGLTPGDVEAYGRQVRDAGLDVVGLHSLFYDHPDLGLFKDAGTRTRTMDFLVHLSGLCRDLGGRTLIYGGGRRRGDVSLADATTEAINFFGELCAKTESHGTVFCLEPLGPNDTDFIHSVHESIAIVEAVDHPGLKVQIDAKALVANDELQADTFAAAKSLLVHVHANEPDLGILGTSGVIDHAAIGEYLRGIGYDGTVSIEQKMIDADAPLDAVGKSTAILKECY